MTKFINKIQSRILDFFNAFSRDYELRIGEVLVKRGIISEKELKKALKMQSDRFLQHHISDPLGMLIVGMGFAKEAIVLDTIKEYYQIPVNSLTDDIEFMILKKREQIKQENKK